MRQMTGYQVRGGDGLFTVYLVRADGEEVPLEQQRAICSYRSRDRAQVVSDALNNGAYSRITRAVNAVRAARRQQPDYLDEEEKRQRGL